MDKSFSLPPIENFIGNKDSLFERLQNSKSQSLAKDITSSYQIALICSNNKLFEKLRKYLYSMPDHFETIQLVDYGEIVNQDYSSLVKIQTILLELGIVPIYLGFDEVITNVLIEANNKLNIASQTALISSNLNLFDNLSENQELDSLIPIGFQSQFCSKSQLAKLLPEYFTQLRLGKIRTNIHLAEPFIRQASLHILDMNVMRNAELNDLDTTGPSGLFSEEVCQIAKYIGIADNLQSFAILGLKNLTETNSWKLIAQIIWYFLLGAENRMDSDNPEISNQTIIYTVESSALDEPLKFIKSTQSGKWWVKHMHIEDKFIPCSYEDYLLSCQNEIPDRILSACFH